MNLKHRPRKRFGQNFLHDQAVIASIVDAIGASVDDHLIEIGPGRGAITKPLLQQLGKLEVVEIDRDLAAQLSTECGGLGEIKIHIADIFKFDFSTLGEAPKRIVGNLPYNISTPLIFHLLKQSANIVDMHFLLQKEVVDRIVAQPGTKDYGRLSVMVQDRCETRKLFKVSAGAFWPVPKVESAFVRLKPKPNPADQSICEKPFAEIVNAAFSQRRKTLRNSLKNLIDPATFEAADIDPATRPERLSIAQFKRLALATISRPQD